MTMGAQAVDRGSPADLGAATPEPTEDGAKSPRQLFALNGSRFKVGVPPRREPAPGKGDDPTKSRLSELDAVEVPVLVVQGKSDPFGMPPKGPNRTVVTVPSDHSLRNGSAVGAAVADWLQTEVIPARRVRRTR